MSVHDEKHDFEICSVKVPREIYVRASGMTESVGEKYKMSCLLAKREDLAKLGESITAEGVLSLATVLGVNHLMRSHGWKLEKWHRGIIVAEESIAVQASEDKESTILEAKEKRINELDYEVVKERRRFHEQLAVIKQYEGIIASLKARIEETKKAVKVEVKTPPRKEINVENIRSLILKEVRRWLVTSESPHQLIVRFKTMTLPKGAGEQEE